MPADEGFRRIQEHEAALAEAAARLQDAEACPAEDPRVAKICSEAEALCRVAEKLADPDANQRCQDARAACTGARERVSHGCATSAPP